MDTRTSPIRMRLTQLREEMARRGIDALLVPSSDPHLSEYLPERWQGRAGCRASPARWPRWWWHAERAALFADSRYWVQAEAELQGTGIELVQDPRRQRQRTTRLAGRAGAARRQTSAVDGQVLGLAAAQALKARLDAAGIVLRTDLDVLDAIWPDRPPCRARRSTPTARRMRRAARAAKLALVREAMARARRDASLRLHRRRHRLADQPARRRRRIQPGVPGAPADRRHGARRCSSATARSTRRCAPNSRPTASRSPPYADAATALAALRRARACCCSTRSA